MINAITTKLEIDVMQASELDSAVQLAVQHSMPAIVVHAQLAQGAIIFKGRRRGRFKIITTIDWPKGDTYAMDKMRGMTEDMMRLDGYEIMLSAHRPEAEIRNEANILSKFITEHLSPLAEVRFVLGTLMRPEADVLRACRALKDVPTPALLRLDHHTKAQVTKANAKTHIAWMERVAAVIRHPVKLSGNIDSVRTIAGCIRNSNGVAAMRLAVNLQQAQTIVRDLQKQPDELKQLLESPQ